jgi:hypothetical protein
LWTPLALAISIGWPAAVFSNDVSIQRLVVIAGAAVFAFALVTLGVSWALGVAPRTRLTVVLHVLFAGVVVSLLSPFVLTQVLAATAGQQQSATSLASSSAPEAMAPLAFMLGLPIALISGMLFSLIALVRPSLYSGGDDVLGDHIFTSNVQPFR